MSASNLPVPTPAVVAEAESDEHLDEPGHPHAVPLRLLLTVYGALVMFTIITYAVSRIDLGPINIWVALLIAVIKGSLVVLYFMHLRWDSPFNALVVIVALTFVALFIALTILDTHYYAPIIKPIPMAPIAAP